MGKYGFKYLIQEFDSNVLNLVEQRGFCPYEYKSGFEKIKEELPSKEKFYSLLTVKKLVTKSYSMQVWYKLEMKTIKDYHDFYLRCNVLVLADVFKKIKILNI